MLPTTRDLKRSQISFAVEVATIIKFMLLKSYQIIVISAMLLLVFLMNSSQHVPLRTHLMQGAALLHQSISKPLAIVKFSYQQLGNLFGNRQTSEELLASNQELKRQITSMQHMELENQQLRQLLNMGHRISYPAAAAEVISENFRGMERKFLINLGSAGGAKEGSVVMGAGGFLGRVIAVSQYTAKVMAIQDKMSNIPVITRSSQKRFIAHGGGMSDAQLLVSYADAEALSDGDEVLTSGDDSFMPKGLLVGKIGRENGKVIINVASNLAQLNYVLVLTEGSANTSLKIGTECFAGNC